MSKMIVFVVHTFSKHGRRLSPNQPFACKTAEEAIRRAERESNRNAGVAAIHLTVDGDTGELLEDPVILYSAGELPSDLTGQD